MVICKKAAWPGDPALTELMLSDRQDSYGKGISNMMFVQWWSSLALKLMRVSADTGRAFQWFTIRVCFFG